MTSIMPGLPHGGAAIEKRLSAGRVLFTIHLFALASAATPELFYSSLLLRRCPASDLKAFSQAVR